MADDSKRPGGHNGLRNYDRVHINTLNTSRKGKHHNLIKAIMEDLTKVERGYAVKVPLESTGGVSVLNLRSAINRAAAKKDISIATSADDENFYVWKS